VAAFRALADPTRIEILRLLAAQRGPTCVCDIVDHFDLAQPTISHHLKVLREAGLLRASRRGIWMFYEADPEGLDVLGEAAELCAPR
jgi:ArsR family transcriptional regulator